MEEETYEFVKLDPRSGIEGKYTLEEACEEAKRLKLWLHATCCPKEWHSPYSHNIPHEHYWKVAHYWEFANPQIRLNELREIVLENISKYKEIKKLMR